MILKTYKKYKEIKNKIQKDSSEFQNKHNEIHLEILESKKAFEEKRKKFDDTFNRYSK